LIEAGKQVSFTYTLSVDGAEVESNKGQEPLTYIQGGGQILPALEAELAELAVGDSKEVALVAADAYGESDPRAIQEVPLEQIPEDARKVGAMLQAEGVPTPIRVTEVREEVVVIDLNHPMAGKDLVFDVEIVAIDEAPAQ
jgi:FKBP-type peptidyl-prolyl cis-trans isomerase 2